MGPPKIFQSMTNKHSHDIGAGAWAKGLTDYCEDDVRDDGVLIFAGVYDIEFRSHRADAVCYNKHCI